MSDIIVIRGEDGKLHGLGESAGRKFGKFQAAVRNMAPGDTMRFSFKLPRSPAFHRRHFAIIGRLHACQEQFHELDGLRKWLEVGAGFCDLVPGPKGRPVAIPRSIAWENLEEADFAEHHADVIRFLRSTYCTRYLWPHLSDQEGDEFINQILAEFGA